MNLLAQSDNYECKTGVINDPLRQPTVPTGSDFRSILKFCDGWTTCVKIVITTGRDCGRPRGSILEHSVNLYGSPRARQGVNRVKM